MHNKVVLLGNSVFIAGLQASLQTQPDMDVLRLDFAHTNLMEKLQSDCPDVIIFDMVVPQTSVLFDFLAKCRSVRLIGLDLNRNEIIVLSGQRHLARAASDLVRIILNSMP